jgi:GAF domain-containing protein
VNDRYPPPSAQSLATAKQVGLTSVLAAPLYARGALLGVMTLALSNLTDRTERHYATADRDVIGAVACQVAAAIDNAIPGRGRAPDRAGPSSISLAAS